MRIWHFLRYYFDGRSFEHMTLRKKTLLIIVAVQLFWFIGHNLVMKIQFEKQLTKIEHDQAIINSEQVKNQIDREFTFLVGKLGDYSGWDATYKFIVDHNPQYLKQDLGESMLMMGVHLIVFVDSKGNIVWSQGADLVKGKLTAAPKSITKKFLTNSPLSIFNHKHAEMRNGQPYHRDCQNQGLIRLPEGIMLMVSRPIVKTDYTGPIRGYMLIGKWLNKQTIGEMSKLMHLNLSLKTPKMPIDGKTDTASQAVIETPSNNLILISASFNDIYGKPLTSIVISAERPINQQKLTMAKFSIVGSFLAMFLLIATTLWIIDRMVLARISRLRNLIGAIQHSNDSHARVFLVGDDELSDLAHSMNGMLTSLEQAQIQQSTMYGKLLQVSRHASMGAMMNGLMHEINNPLTVIKGNVALLAQFANPSLIENPKMQTFIKIQDRAINSIISVMSKFKAVLQHEDLDVKLLDIGTIIEQTLQIVSRNYVIDGIELIRSFTAPITMLPGNVNKIQQMILNLLANAHNALEKCSSKKIIVHTAVENDNFILRVMDTGSGIENNDIPALLDAAALLERAMAGKGIGLSIVYDIVQGLGGTLECSSRLHEGSSFAVSIPLPLKMAA